MEKSHELKTYDPNTQVSKLAADGEMYMKWLKYKENRTGTRKGHEGGAYSHLVHNNTTVGDYEKHPLNVN